MRQLAQLAKRLQTIPFHTQLRHLRWLTPLFVLVLAALHQTLVHLLASFFSGLWRDLVELMVYGLTGSIIAWIGLTWIAANVARRTEAETQLRSACIELETNHQKLLALHDLGEKIAAADSEQAILELAAQAPLQLTSACASTVVTFDDNHNQLNLNMVWGLSDAYVRALRTYMSTGIDAERCRSCTALKAHAGSDCPLFAGLHDEARAEGIRSLTCLPIVREQDRVGVISAYFPSVNGLSEDLVRLLNILGGAIAAMLENLRTRTRQVHALNALDATLRQPDALDNFTTQVLNITLTGWEAQAGGLFLCDDQAQTWTCCASHGLGQAMTDPRFDLALQMARQSHTTGHPVVFPELEADAAHDLLSAAAAPLTAEGQALGAVFLAAKRRRALTEHHAELLTAVARQAGLAIRNIQIYDQLKQMAVYEERYRLSREIHDGLAQVLAYLGLQAERLEKLLATGRSQDATHELAEMRQSIRGAYVDAREAIDGLRLSVDNPDQLADRLSNYVADFARQSNIQASFVSEPEDLTTDPNMALQLLRIAQEALTNVRKHAHARNVQVRLVASASELELTVADDGRGFPGGAQSNRPFQRHGLASMRERAQSIGGTLSVATGPEQGTCVTVLVPWRGAP